MWWGAWLLSACEPLPCDFDDDCSGGEMCLERVCQPATDRWWNVEMSSAEVGPDHPDGAPWDDGGGPPDLYVEFGLPSDACVTSIVSRSYEPAWFETCEFYIPHDPTFYVDLWDADGMMFTDAELAASYTWIGTDEFTDLARAATGHDAGWVDTSGTVVMWVRLWPL